MASDHTCARCGHHEHDHAHGVCRACASQEQHVRYSNAAPAHRFYYRTDPADMHEAELLREHDAATAYEAWQSMVNEQDDRGH